jgi:hypothetical protein
MHLQPARTCVSCARAASAPLLPLLLLQSTACLVARDHVHQPLLLPRGLSHPLSQARSPWIMGTHPPTQPTAEKGRTAMDQTSRTSTWNLSAAFGGMRLPAPFSPYAKSDTQSEQQKKRHMVQTEVTQQDHKGRHGKCLQEGQAHITKKPYGCTIAMDEASAILRPACQHIWQGHTVQKHSGTAILQIPPNVLVQSPTCTPSWETSCTLITNHLLSM